MNLVFISCHLHQFVFEFVDCACYLFVYLNVSVLCRLSILNAAFNKTTGLFSACQKIDTRIGTRNISFVWPNWTLTRHSHHPSDNQNPYNRIRVERRLNETDVFLFLIIEKRIKSVSQVNNG